VKKCTTKLISGSVSFTAVGNARASLVRRGVIYATGIVARKGLVLRAQRRIPVGRYTLRIRSGNQTTGTPITVT
jgi:hypothetical protein